jgi:hypothetical protein
MEQPPVIVPPVKKRRIRTLLYVLLALAAAVVAMARFFHVVRPKPPKESELLETFQKNRAAFEQLRDMFRADNNLKLRRVADWGIATYKPYFYGKPTAANFPIERYQQYLRLLHQVGSTMAFSRDDGLGNPTIEIWGARWLDHSMYIHISWMDEVPTNQVTDLDQCRAPKRDGQHFYRHIDESWYLDTDMRPF